MGFILLRLLSGAAAFKGIAEKNNIKNEKFVEGNFRDILHELQGHFLILMVTDSIQECKQIKLWCMLKRVANKCEEQNVTLLMLPECNTLSATVLTFVSSSLAWPDEAF